MLRGVYVFLGTFLATTSVMFAQDVPIKGVDLFGTSQITIEQIQQRFVADYIPAMMGYT